MDELLRERGVDGSGALGGTLHHRPARSADDVFELREVGDGWVHRAEVAGEDWGRDIGALDVPQSQVEAREGLRRTRHGDGVAVIERLARYAREESAVACGVDVERDRVA